MAPKLNFKPSARLTRITQPKLNDFYAPDVLLKDNF